MKRRNAATLGVGLLLVVGIGAVALLQQRLDPEALRRAVVASVERQSGRSVTLGQLDVRLLPWPHISADRLTLGDRPGAADPVMLRIGHLDARIGLWPLLRHVVRLDRLKLDHVALHVRRDADGHGNWEMDPRPAASGRGSGTSHGTARWGVAFDDVRLDEVQLSLHDESKRRGAEVHLATLAGSGLQGGQPHFSLAGEQGGAGYTVAGSVGPIGRLLDGSDRRTEWPVSLQAAETVGGSVVGRAHLVGTITDPARGRGYDLAATATIAQLRELNRLFAHANLPAMQELDASAHVVDAGHPAIVALRAKAGVTGIPGMRDLVVQNWSAAAGAPAAPIDLALSGSWRGQAVVLQGTAASLEALQAAVPVPVRLSLGLGGTSWQVDGRAGLDGSDLQLRGTVPDPRTLAADAPAIGPVTMAARVQTGPGPSLRLSELQLTSAAGDLGGTLTLSLRGRPTLSGALHSNRIDSDRLFQGHVAVGPARGPPPGQASAAGTPVLAAPAPDRLLPWPLLRLADADLALQVAELRIGGQPYLDFTTHAVLQDGRLLLEPRARGPDGVLSGRLQLDATSVPPGLRVWMHPVLLPAPLLARWLGRPDALRGTVELVGELQASGTTRSALAASAAGHVGVSMTNGAVANAGLLRLVGGSSAIAAVLPVSGETGVRCLALHATVGGGQAALDTLSLRTGALSIDGSGGVGVLDGALDLHLRPDVRVGGTWISMPVRLEGKLQDPRPRLDDADPAGRAAGRYSLTIGGAGNGAPDCQVPLQAAREGIAGPAAGAAVEPAGGGRHKAPRPIDILRGLGILH